jgi:hypothetical protein
MAAAEKELASLRREAASAAGDRRRELYFRARQVQRRIAFANPLLDFDSLVCNKMLVTPDSHMCTQYLRGSDRDAIVVVANLFADNATADGMLGGSECEDGEHAGESLTPGTFLQPDLDFAGRRVTFAHNRNLYVANVDGTGLRQLAADGLDWDTQERHALRYRLAVERRLLPLLLGPKRLPQPLLPGAPGRTLVNVRRWETPSVRRRSCR